MIMRAKDEPPSRESNYTRKSFDLMSCWAEIDDVSNPIDYSSYDEYIRILRESGKVDEL